jgi:hypothetical protein
VVNILNGKPHKKYPETYEKKILNYSKE